MLEWRIGMLDSRVASITGALTTCRMSKTY